MSMLTNLDLIRRVPLFSMLTEEQAQLVADGVVKRRYRRGELVVEQGKKSNALFILLNGRARVLTAEEPGGTEQRLTVEREDGTRTGALWATDLPCATWPAIPVSRTGRWTSGTGRTWPWPAGPTP